ncbi:MAG TPA: ABC transporter permease [Thermoanaerobaculia bacterium]
MNLQRIRHMLIKEFIQLRRDPRMRAVIFVVPVLQTIVFGYAVTTDVRHVKTVLIDHDRSTSSRELVARFTGSGLFDVVAQVEDVDDAQKLVDREEASTVIRIEHGFDADLRAGRMPAVQLIVDGTDSNTAAMVLNYATRIVTTFDPRARVNPFGARAPAPLATRAWFNPNLESRNFYVPGVIALLVALITLLLSSMAVVREKEIGTIEQIIVTPITQPEFILGKTAPFVVIAYIDVLLVTAVAVFWFDIAIRGSLLLLFGGTALFILSTIAVGLVISTISTTQQQAMMTTFFYFLPAVLLSGFLFPITNMPRVIQWLTFLNPLRYFLVIVRGIFLKGSGFAILWPQFAALLVLGTATLLFASTRFRKTLA